MHCGKINLENHSQFFQHSNWPWLHFCC
jgi:hypothetical protein